MARRSSPIKGDGLAQLTEAEFEHFMAAAARARGQQEMVVAPATRRWNVLLTVHPTPGAVHELLGALHRFGEFRMTPFRYVCTGWVKDTATFLDALLEAEQAGRGWTRHIARVVPVAYTFEFSPDSLQGKLEAAADEAAAKIAGGTCFVRVERRGLGDEIDTSALERAVADHLFAAVEARGGALRTSFEDPDYIVAVETIGSDCGIALITREMRQRYPFMSVR